MQQIQWQDRFNIGVEIVDQAHRRLFSIVQKITELYVEKHESKFACMEGIKYFRAYAVQHFAEEEAYMRQIGYPGYPSHKWHHDKMRQETLPALEHELYDTDFSTEAVQHFIGVCIGWLTGHIMIEDRAIIRTPSEKPIVLQPTDERSVVLKMILSPLQEMFGPDIQFVGHFFQEDTIIDAQYYELTYHIRQNTALRFILITNEELLLHAAGLMFGIQCHTMNDVVRFAIREETQTLLQRAAVCFEQDFSVYRLMSDRFLTPGQYRQHFEEHAPQHSLLFRTKPSCFALCIDRLPESD